MINWSPRRQAVGQSLFSKQRCGPVAVFLYLEADRISASAGSTGLATGRASWEEEERFFSDRKGHGQVTGKVPISDGGSCVVGGSYGRLPGLQSRGQPDRGHARIDTLQTRPA